MLSGYIFGSGELVLMLFHPHTGSMEHDAFRFQPNPLFEAVFTRERDFAAGGDHSMPGQPTCASERPDNLTSTAGETCRARDVAIGGHLAFRYFPNGVTDDFEHENLLGAIPG